jgi:hypothetical protein
MSKTQLTVSHLIKTQLLLITLLSCSVGLGEYDLVSIYLNFLTVMTIMRFRFQLIKFSPIHWFFLLK